MNGCTRNRHLVKMVKKQKQEQITSGSSSSSSSSSRLNVVVSVELTEDLIMEICSHLHPLSLLRFKSVSKKWYSLISNPHFLRRHTLHQFRTHNPYNSHTILLHRYSNAGNSDILILPSPPPPQNNDDYRNLSPLLLQNLIDYRPEQDDGENGKFAVADSCNGLLLYTFHHKIHQIPPIEKFVWYVCNPITHDYIKLPTFEQEIENEQGLKIWDNLNPNIVFDPSLSLTYKVVIWLKCHRSQDDDLQEHYRLYVYSSETRIWRLSISTNQFPVDPRQFNYVSRAVLCNGVLYWSVLNPPIYVTLCYDVEKDIVSTLKFPNVPVGYRHRVLLYLGECCGCLCLIENYYKCGKWINDFPSIFDVMELKDGGLWMVKYRVNIGEGYYASLIRKNSFHNVYILDLYKTKMEEIGGEEEVLLLRISDICIIPFNLSSSTFGKELRNQEKKPMGDYFIAGFTNVLRYNTITLFPPSSS